MCRVAGVAIGALIDVAHSVPLGLVLVVGLAGAGGLAGHFFRVKKCL